MYVTVTHAEVKFEEVLQSIKTAPWYTTNTKLQEYLMVGREVDSRACVMAAKRETVESASFA